jgi:CubicO group peptidase (beta-lactamase class C family)
VISLIEEKILNLNDKISKYLPSDYMDRLHVFKGVDYSNEITVRHLMSNTSGLPDYFTHSASSSLLEGVDEAWGFDKAVNMMKNVSPKFAPGKKVAYSDTNYQLLGKVIETVTGNNINKVFMKYIFDKLGLYNTYVYEDITDKAPAAFYYKDKRLWLPNYMTSIAVEGGIVSTAEEVSAFLKAFFNGRLFSKEKIQELKMWKLMLPPPGTFYYGIGLEKQFLPRIMVSPLKPINEVIGFWGQTSAFAWYNPDTDLYFSGTANQANGSGHTAIMKSIIKIIKSVL